MAFGGKRDAERRPPGSVAEGRVLEVDIPHRKVMFTIDTYDPTLSFGPAPYTPCPAGQEPAPGDRCVIAWPSQGVESPWVLSWSVD